MSKLKNRLEDLMQQKEPGKMITQDKLAEATGVSQSAISRWLRQYVDRYDAEVIVKFCEYFECEVGDLLYIDRSDSP
jgi:DNA-binding Xre family transcriptional regulator